MNATTVISTRPIKKTWVARVIAYVFLGSFCIAGPSFLVIALGAAEQRAVLIYTGSRAEGRVIAKRSGASNGSGHVTYAPVVQFTDRNGVTHTVNSDVYGKESAFKYGALVGVLYRHDHPESARIDDFAQLWTFPLVIGVVGTGFSVIPAIMVIAWMRRRTGDVPRDSVPAHSAADTLSRGLRWALGLLLTGGGLFLIANGLGFVSSNSNSASDSRVLIISFGVLLTASGVQVAGWVAMQGRASHALGSAAITSMAVLFGWVAMFGQSSGFRGSASIGNAAVSSTGPVTPARIAFAIGSLVFGLAALRAWIQVWRPRE